MTEPSEDKPKRKGIPKKMRFEVFKRDSFTCQYCGATASTTLLHCDHIDPVASGGKTTLLNLITSCEDCNLGKGAVALSDGSAVNKKHAQAAKLNERRQQIEMMAEWHKGLIDLDAVSLDSAHALWKSITGYGLNEHGISELKKKIRDHGLSEVMAAMRVAMKYLDSNRSSESIGVAFGKIGGICRVSKMSKEDPDYARVQYLKGIYRNKFNTSDAWKLEIPIRNILAMGYGIEELIARCRREWVYSEYRARALLDEILADCEKEVRGG